MPPHMAGSGARVMVFESMLGDEIIVSSDADSLAGQTLVTLTINTVDSCLTPEEARELSVHLLNAAGLAVME